MNEHRIRHLNEEPVDESGTYVLYWMLTSQRASFNPSLEYAARVANRNNQPLIVAFGLGATSTERRERQTVFMLEGLAEVAGALHARDIKFVVLLREPPKAALALAENASQLVCDRGYLRQQRRWADEVAGNARKRVTQVEGDIVVPVAVASDKAEYAARTIRPKLREAWPDFLEGLTETGMQVSSLPLHVTGDVDVRDIESVLSRLELDRSVKRSERFRGGTSRAREQLRRFLQSDFPGYDGARNDPSAPQCSTLSPYLRFGQLSPVEVVRKVQSAKGGSSADKEAFLEELIVRRELARNFVQFQNNYDSFACLPDWARETLEKHKADKRPQRYTRKELEAASTDDEYWNASMQEMLKTGYMHNHMRMYWGKKILEWCNTPEYAFTTALYLNNKYFLDGCDANSYANVAWIFGLHDRPWQERKVFGKVRYMNADGLRRKFDVDAYCQWVENL